MSKLLIDKHLKGKIEVSNNTFFYNDKEYLGAEFTITLPLEINND